MRVDRIYPLATKMHEIERLWSKETVFSNYPTAEGVRLTKQRLVELRDGLTEVINELEEEEWLL